MSAKKETVIVADDDPRLLRLVQFNLQQAGYRVITASDGNRALRLAENENPDLILLDVRMPLMDGLEVCRRIRQRGIFVFSGRKRDPRCRDGPTGQAGSHEPHAWVCWSAGAVFFIRVRGNASSAEAICTQHEGRLAEVQLNR